MHESELRAIEELEELPLFDEDDPAIEDLIAETSADSIAEVEDTVRLHELLHRNEYQALAAVRFRETQQESIRVYFRLHHRDQ